MIAILTNLRNAVLSGFALAALLFAMYFSHGDYDGYAFSQFFFRWLHVLSGIMWVGLLWYFNFVQIPNMPNIPDEQKPAIGKVIAPAALWWFRWAAVATILTGLVVASLNGYLYQALSLGLIEDSTTGHRMIGIGMWIGIIMFANVWLVIWPNQKKALGIIEVDNEIKMAAARRAMLFSRKNTILSVPMLFAMVSYQNLY